MTKRRLALIAAGILAIATESLSQVAKGELEPWTGFVMTSLNENTKLVLITLSANEYDGMVSVGFLMDPAKTPLPEIKGVADLEYRGEQSVLVTLKATKQRYVFMVDSQSAPANATTIRVAGIQRLGFKPKAFMHHAEAASEVFKNFKVVPGRPTRDKKPAHIK